MPNRNSGNDKLLLPHFLKWAGGKRWLASHLNKLSQKVRKRYFEPFLGGGSVFFAINPARAVLSDKNSELILTYKAIRDNPKKVVTHLAGLRYSTDDYYRIRDQRPVSRFARAARFIYLNRSCWNGLYRVNRKGDFNVPFGDFTNPTIYDEPSLLKISRLLKNTTLTAGDFSKTLSRAKKGDFVYLDPPYTVAHGNNGFVKYNEHMFSWSDQKRLAKVAFRLKRRGCRVLISNASHESIRKLYRGFHVRTLSRISLLAADSTKRSQIEEVLLSSFKLPSSFGRKA